MPVDIADGDAPVSLLEPQMLAAVIAELLQEASHRLIAKSMMARRAA